MEDLESLLSKAVDYIVFFFLKIRDMLTSFLFNIFNIELTFHNLLFLLISFIMFTVLVSLIYVVIKSNRKKLKEPVLESSVTDKPLELSETSLEGYMEEVEGVVAPIEEGYMEEVEGVVAPIEEGYMEEVEV
jgi:hypothetical protein